jgi:hypothetical protein
MKGGRQLANILLFIGDIQQTTLGCTSIFNNKGITMNKIALIGNYPKFEEPVVTEEAYTEKLYFHKFVYIKFSYEQPLQL